MWRKLISSGTLIRGPIIRRHASGISQLGEHKSLIIEQYGEPTDVVKLKISKPTLPKQLEPNQILVKHLAACVNPADTTLVRGLYGERPTLPAIIGNEGITEVLDVGTQVKHLSPGDLALGVTTSGYWQSYSIQDADKFYHVDKDLEIPTAVQLKVNPATAFRMLKDFVDLKRGDTVIQNGANSAVGVYVIQLAKLWGLTTINVIREESKTRELVDELKGFGADYVVTDSEIGNVEYMKPILKELNKPRILLDCVGGKNATNCQRFLGQGGYFVTYGSMSKQPTILPVSSLIFKDITHKGFWVSRWYKDRETTRRDEITLMLDEIVDMFKRGALKPKASTMITFEERNRAFGGSNNTKYIFSINER